MSDEDEGEENPEFTAAVAKLLDEMASKPTYDQLEARIHVLETEKKALVGLIRRWVDFENGKRNLDTLKGIKERAEALLNEPKEERE